MPQDESSEARQFIQPSFILDMLAGGTASAISKTVVAPMERVKLLLQVQTKLKGVEREENYKGLLDCFARVFKEQGFFSFWRGNLVNVIRVFPLQALSFSLKDRFKELIVKEEYHSSFWKLFLANLASGGAASAVSLSVVYPLDFARTRLAADPGRTRAEREFSGMGHCLVKTIKSDGIVGVYRGFLISLPGVIMYRAVSLGGFDTAKALIPPSRDSMGTSLCIALGITALATIATHPCDTVRAQMVLHSGPKSSSVLYTSTLDCWAKVYRSGGAAAFLRGLVPSILTSPGNALCILLYEELKSHLHRNA